MTQSALHGDEDRHSQVFIETALSDTVSSSGPRETRTKNGNNGMTHGTAVRGCWLRCSYRIVSVFIVNEGPTYRSENTVGGDGGGGSCGRSRL